MATTLYMSPISLIIQYLNNQGIIAQGAKLYTYVGGASATPVTTYTDSSGLVANPNPMTLQGGGRPASASSALVAFWVPAGTVIRLVVNDAGGNQLVFLDNITSLNDPSSTGNALTQLANPASGSGSDLVANAQRSYDVFASMRSANVPVLASGQTLIVAAEGQTTINDGLGGSFYWDSTNTNADDNFTYIKPSGAAGAGRYVRLLEAQPVLIGAGTFTAALSGMTGTVNVTCQYLLETLTYGGVTFKRVTLVVGTGNNPTYTGTSNATTMTLTGIPATIVPATNTPMQSMPLEDNGAWAQGFVQWLAGVLTFGKTFPTAGAFTASATKGIPSFTFVYTVG